MSVPYLPIHEHWTLGRRPDRPIRIFAVLDLHSFGDFISSVFFVNCVADRFDHRIVTLLYRQSPAYQTDIVRLLPGANYIEVPPDRPLPSLDMVTGTRPPRQPDPQFEDWFGAGLNSQDLFITADMALCGYLWCFDHHSRLTIPEAWNGPAAEDLVRRGLDPNRWFCTIHAREPGYAGKPTKRNIRDCDPMLYWATAAYVIQELGGQVVRLGDPAMTPWPAMKGLVDLTGTPDNTRLQAVAISKARFHFSGPSGPAALADALDVPTAMADVVEYFMNNDKWVLRTADFITPEGRVYRQKELFDAGYHKMKILQLLQSGQGYRLVKNSAEELQRLAAYIFEMTADTPGWRAPAKPAPWTRPNQFYWPPGEPRPRGHFLPI